MRFLIVLTASALLAGCAASGPKAAPSPSPDGRVAFVRMEALVKKHPLYGQLAQYDADIQALNLNALVPKAVAAGPELQQQEADLERQLDAAAKRTNALLQAKGEQYQRREEDAIAAALRAANTTGGPTVSGISSQMEATARGQVGAVATQAQRDLEAYRRQLESADKAQLAAAERALNARADRSYRAKIDELNAKEAALSLKLAQDDASQRLSLRAKLSSLALDDAQRDDVTKQLAALDKKESDAIAVEHARDQQTLSAYQGQLRTQIHGELDRQVAQIHQRSVDRYRQRADQLRTQFQPPSGPVIAMTMKNGKPTTQINPNLPPDLRARIAALHADYSKAFQADAKQTIADFNKTRADLQKRYTQLRELRTSSERSAMNEMASLQHKRESLYDQMVGQIGREVKTIAQQHGISVVLSNVAAAPAGGIDLTDEAMKDIETLHE